MTARDVFVRVLRYGGLLAAAIAVIGSVAGYLLAGTVGLVSALIGTALAFVFLSVTAASIVLASRVAGSDLLSPRFFLIVMGGWMLKFVVFLILVFVLKGQPWVNNVVLFLSIIAGVIGSLVVDVVVIARSRLPLLPDALSGERREPSPDDAH